MQLSEKLTFLLHLPNCAWKLCEDLSTGQRDLSRCIELLFLVREPDAQVPYMQIRDGHGGDHQDSEDDGSGPTRCQTGECRLNAEITAVSDEEAAKGEQPAPAEPESKRAKKGAKSG